MLYRCLRLALVVALATTCVALRLSPGAARFAPSSSEAPVPVPQVGTTGGYREFAFSPDGTEFVSVGRVDGTLALWDTRTLTLKRVLLESAGPGDRGQGEVLPTVLFTRDQRSVVVNYFPQNTGAGTQTRHAVVVDLRTGLKTRDIPDETYLDEGRVLARYRSDGIFLADAVSGRQLAFFPLSEPANGPQSSDHSPNATDNLGLTDTNCAFSSDLRRMALAANGTVRVFDLAAGISHPTVTLSDGRGHLGKTSGAFGPITFSLDSRSIATCGEDPKFNPAPGDTFANSSDDEHPLTVKIWDAKTGALRKALANYGSRGQRVSLLRFSPDARRLLIGDSEVRSDSNGKLDARDATTPAFRLLWHRDADGLYALSPNGTNLLIGRNDNLHDVPFASATLIDAAKGRKRGELPPAPPPGKLAWSRDSHWLFDGTRAWNLAHGVAGPSWPVLWWQYGEVRFLPDGGLWTNVLKQAEIRDIETGKLRKTFGDGSKPEQETAFQRVSPDGRFFTRLGMFLYSPLEVYTLPQGTFLCRLREHQLSTPVISPDWQRIATISFDIFAGNKILVWDSRGKLLQTFSDNTDSDSEAAKYFDSFVFTPDNRQMYMMGSKGPRLYDLQSGVVTTVSRQEYNHARSLLPASLRHEDAWTVVSQPNGGVEVRDAANHVQQHFDEPLIGAVLSPDKRWLAGTERGRTVLYEVATGRKAATLVSFPRKSQGVSAGVDASAWLITTPNGFYAASKTAIPQIRWRVGQKTYPGATFARCYLKLAWNPAILASKRH